MKIAYATIYDARDVNRGSGWPYYLTQELKRQGHDVYFIGPISVPIPLITRILRKASVKLGKRYRTYQDIFVGRRIGALVSKRIAHSDCDVVLTNDYAIAAYTRLSKPLVLYTDAIFPANYKENEHPRLANLSLVSAAFCQHITRRGLTRADKCILASAWGCEEVRKYGVIDDGKLSFIPFGANLNAKLIQKMDMSAGPRVLTSGKIDLLFVGKDWNRKGGDIAVAVVQELRNRGIQAQLHVVGPRALPESAQVPYVQHYGFLDKNDPGQLEKLVQFYRDCDVFIMPSVAEGLGIAFLEAAAFGMPSIGYSTMGVTSAVNDGESGILLPLDSPATAFADVICQWLDKAETYVYFVQASRHHFASQGSWSSVVIALVEKLSQL